MMILKKYFLCLSFFLLIFLFVSYAQAVEWHEAKGKHFVVCYDNILNRSAAEKTLWQAEKHYTKIAVLIGYARYSQFWTWGDRVRIFLFSNQKAFSEQTKQPQWSRGGAFHSQFSDQRMIASYPNQPDFFSEVLPHEITHLILRDFVGSQSKIPSWFNEGVAQLAEDKKAQKADIIMRISIRLNRYFPFESLMSYNIATETDEEKVGLFYAQSVSMVDFLIKRFGSDRFGVCCRHIATGKDFQEAFRLAYGLHLESVKSFEKKWIQYLENN